MLQLHPDREGETGCREAEAPGGEGSAGRRGETLANGTETIQDRKKAIPN